MSKELVACTTSCSPRYTIMQNKYKKQHEEALVVTPYPCSQIILAVTLCYSQEAPKDLPSVLSYQISYHRLSFIHTCAPFLDSRATFCKVPWPLLSTEFAKHFFVFEFETSVVAHKVTIYSPFCYQAMICPSRQSQFRRPFSSHCKFQVFVPGQSIFKPPFFR